MSEYAPLNPVQIESEIRKATTNIAQCIEPASEAYSEWQLAELEFKKVFAEYFVSESGSVEDRKQKAVLKSYDAATAARVAEAKYKRIVDYQRSFRDKLSALQSVQKSVNAAYQMAGHDG